MYSHCTTGGWVLGNSIDGTQAEYVRIPHAETSLYPIPSGADEEALVMLSDVLPTAFECGVLNGKVAPGSTVAIVGAGPVGLTALLMAHLFSPAAIILIDLDSGRLEFGRRFGATYTVNNSDGTAPRKVKELTGGRGVDTAIEVVGIPATFHLCQDLVAPGGTIANIGVHGTKVDLHLERLGRITLQSPRGSWTLPPPPRCSRSSSRRRSSRNSWSHTGSGWIRSWTPTKRSATRPAQRP